MSDFSRQIDRAVERSRERDLREYLEGDGPDLEPIRQRMTDALATLEDIQTDCDEAGQGSAFLLLDRAAAEILKAREYLGDRYEDE